jgi:hypothetical protein
MEAVDVKAVSGIGEAWNVGESHCLWKYDVVA